MPEYQVKQSCDERKKSAQQRIISKLAILDKWEKEGTTRNDVTFMPTSIAAFCKWADETLQEVVLIDGKKTTIDGVFPFTESTIHKKHNSDFKVQVENLIEKLNSRRTKKGQKSELRDLKAQNNELKIAIQNITNKLVESRCQVSELQKLFSAKKAEVDRLTIRLRNIVPIFPTGIE